MNSYHFLTKRVKELEEKYTGCEWNITKLKEVLFFNDPVLTAGESALIKDISLFKSRLISNTHLAGGCIRRFLLNESIIEGDIDLWFSSDYKHQFISLLVANDWNIIKETNYAYTLKHKKYPFTVQIIKLVYNNTVINSYNMSYNFTKRYRCLPGIDLILDSFDFTVCQFCSDWDLIYTNPISLYDLDNKYLRINLRRKNILTNSRIEKYIKLGYNLHGKFADILLENFKKHGTYIPLRRKIKEEEFKLLFPTTKKQQKELEEYFTTTIRHGSMIR